MANEWIDMSTFEYLNPEKDASKQALDSTLFLRVTASEEPLSQRALVRNAFLNRVDSDPTLTPYDSIPMNYWKETSESASTARAIPATDLSVRGYYEGRSNNLYFTDRSKS